LDLQDLLQALPLESSVMLVSGELRNSLGFLSAWYIYYYILLVYL
jgi:hypothetical protein